MQTCTFVWKRQHEILSVWSGFCTNMVGIFRSMPQCMDARGCVCVGEGGAAAWRVDRAPYKEPFTRTVVERVQGSYRGNRVARRLEIQFSGNTAYTECSDSPATILPLTGSVPSRPPSPRPPPPAPVRCPRSPARLRGVLEVLQTCRLWRHTP